MWEALTAARDALAQIDCLVSCKIGMEDAISPADFPLIRIEPEQYDPGKPYQNRTATINIVFGMPYAPSEGLELVFERLHDLDDEIRAVLRDVLKARYLQTVWFDRRANVPYKLAAIRCEIMG